MTVATQLGVMVVRLKIGFIDDVKPILIAKF
jgi:hypothetical protein